MIDKSVIVNNIKTMKDINDDIQDEVLENIVLNTEKHLLLKIKRMNKDVKEVPEELDFIVEEISIRRYNNIGSEGMKSESVEGHAITFYEMDDYFKPYQEIIDDFEDDDFDGGKRGKVILI